jgi:hypothetical protein
MDGSSSRVILVCEECGELTVLGGPLSVWYSASTYFGCECGKELTLADRLDQQSLAPQEEASVSGKITSVRGLTSPLYR